MSFRLQVACPQITCPRTPLFWSHFDCGGDMYMDKRGFLSCQKCNYKAFIKYWSFKCNSSEHNNKWVNFDMSGILLALCSVSTTVKGSNSSETLAMQEMIEEICKYISQNWSKL